MAAGCGTIARDSGPDAIAEPVRASPGPTEAPQPLLAEGSPREAHRRTAACSPPATGPQQYPRAPPATTACPPQHPPVPCPGPRDLDHPRALQPSLESEKGSPRDPHRRTTWLRSLPAWTALQLRAHRRQRQPAQSDQRQMYGCGSLGLPCKTRHPSPTVTPITECAPEPMLLGDEMA